MIVKLIDTPSDPVRLAFLHVFTKRPGMARDDGTTGPAKFEVTAILEPDGENAKRVKAAIQEVAKEKWGDKQVIGEDGTKVPAYKQVLADLDEDRSGLRRGNKKRTPNGDIYDGFEGKLYITARSEKRPGVYNRDRSALTEEDGVIYSGAYGTVHIDIWALKKRGVKPCIVADLSGLQFTRDGDAFGGGAAPAKADDFDDLSEGGGADSSSLEDDEEKSALLDD